MYLRTTGMTPNPDTRAAHCGHTLLALSGHSNDPVSLRIIAAWDALRRRRTLFRGEKISRDDFTLELSGKFDEPIATGRLPICLCVQG